jgi:phosphate transport system permease protein
VEAGSATTAAPVSGIGRTRKLYDRIGDRALYIVTALAALVSALLVVAIAYQLVKQAWPAIQKYGLSFVWQSAWRVATPTLNELYGAREFLIGTVVASFGAILIATPLSIAIGLFLTELAPPRVRSIIGSIVDMLAAVPSVVIGLWGILILAPFVHSNIEPALHDVFGWLGIFGPPPPSAESVFVAMIVLAIMATPIISSICRELFLNVDPQLKEAAIGLGATRWETVRGVIVPTVRGGVVAGVVLGLGRALGEAIAVTQVIGGSFPIRLNLFEPGTSLASQIAASYSSDVSVLNRASLIYLGLILLVITFTTNWIAQRIVHRFDRKLKG